MKALVRATVLVVTWGAVAVRGHVPVGSAGEAVEPDARAMIASAIEFLRAKQDPATGGWSVNPREGAPQFPAITALVLRGMIENRTVDQDDPAVRRGVDYVLRFRREDGGIFDRVLPSYNTSICVSLLSRLEDPRARAAIDPAVRFLRTLQFGEDATPHEGLGESARPVDRAHVFYGGVGYGRAGRPDVSNTSFFLEALHDAGVDGTDPAFQRALVFLQRVQMSERFNDQPYAAGSSQGGFIYATSVGGDAAGGGQSYAGEIAESLSGPPGCVAQVRLVVRDGAPVVLDRAEVEARIGRALAAVPEVRDLGDRFMVLPGPTTDGRRASQFEVRAEVEQPEHLDRLLVEALGADLDAPALRVERVGAWRGVSRLRAYGSMTYAGFKSYVYADLSRNDPRVLAALNWISRNYTLEENPGLGTDGMYYYYLMFARALRAWGEDRIEVITPQGVERRDWASDLVARLATLQEADGGFRPVDDRWMENDRVLITAYALVALQQAAR